MISVENEELDADERRFHEEIVCLHAITNRKKRFRVAPLKLVSTRSFARSFSLTS